MRRLARRVVDLGWHSHASHQPQLMQCGHAASMLSWQPKQCTASQQQLHSSHVLHSNVQHQHTSASLITADGLTPAVLADIMHCAQQRQTGISLRYILNFGTQPLSRQMLISAQFLQTELPIRLAHRLAELNALPLALSNNLHLTRVKRWYADSFIDIRSFPPPKNDEDVAQFTKTLQTMLARHAAVVPAVAKGVEEYKRGLVALGVSESELSDSLQEFLDRFFMSRIALRFLAGHHVALHEQALQPPEQRASDRVGLVYTRCSPLQVVRDAVNDARDVCMRVRGDCPEVILHCPQPTLTMPYVPSHLHHMVFELVKNSLRAVAERYDQLDQMPPPVRVVVATGTEDITIKVADQGGGIPRSGQSRIWTYLYTTSRSPLPDVDDNDETYQGLPAVLAGYGCGLSLSRLYARYFGGEMAVYSMQGYGTDAYLHLSRLGNTEEPLPSWPMLDK